jgi:3-methyladenine DNA glycosylase AlkD
MKTACDIRELLRRLGDRRQAANLQRFFKTGPGEYGEGDVFLGIKVPLLRKFAKEHECLHLREIVNLLKSPVHEERLLALLLLVSRFRKGGEKEKKGIYELYLKNTQFVNNWDLVDLTAPHIIGGFLEARSRRPLNRLARSSSLWERRIAIVSTLYFIRDCDFSDTLRIARILLSDKEDLIHKAVGWALREVGKKDMSVEEDFLKTCYTTMPRTMLRYAIERFPEVLRQKYLKGKI